MLIGLAVVSADEFLFSAARGATLLLLYVSPPHRGSFAAPKLWRAVHKFATENHAAVISAHVTSSISIDKAHRFFTRLGFRLTGGNYIVPTRTTFHLFPPSQQTVHPPQITPVRRQRRCI